MSVLSHFSPPRSFGSPFGCTKAPFPHQPRLKRDALGRTKYTTYCKHFGHAMENVKSGHRVFVTGLCAYPREAVSSLAARCNELSNVELFTTVFTQGNIPHLDPALKGKIRHVTCFIGGPIREAVNSGEADYIPCFFSAMPSLLSRKSIPIDVAIIHVSPPDSHGFCSFGIEVSTAPAAAHSAEIVIAHINPLMPRTLGDSFIHISKIHYAVVKEEVLANYITEPEEKFGAIGKHISQVIEDGDCLQLGIGALPDAVLKHLKDKRNLGMHTEMFTDGIMDLIETGILNGSQKTFHPEKVIATFCMGSQKLYDFVNNSPCFEFHPVQYVNHPINIAKNANMVSINSALEIDLTGQVCAESIGTKFFSGIGGQLDFVRGAAMSKGGKPIIAVPSTKKLKNGELVSKIVPMLKHGAGVTTTRFDVHYVATEYGIVDLFGKSIRQRARALIGLAHPAFRPVLEKEAYKLKYI